MTQVAKTAPGAGGTAGQGRRLAILVTCTTLSLPGLLMPALFALYSVNDTLLCMARRDPCGSGLGMAFAYLVLATVAWSFYFWMGRAWIARRPLSPWVPAVGCGVGFLAANLVGLTGWRPVGVLFALPAAMLACWLTGYHWLAWLRARRHAG
jgi:hypothetical protein